MAFGADDIVALVGPVVAQALKNASQQRTNSFDNRPNRGLGVDPNSLLQNGVADTHALFGAGTDMLGRGINLRSSYAQDLPSFSGGALPMQIGAFASDPASHDSSLLSIPGLNIHASSQKSSNVGTPNDIGGPAGDGHGNPNNMPTEGKAVPRPGSGASPTPGASLHTASSYAPGQNPQGALAAFRMLGYDVGGKA